LESLLLKFEFKFIGDLICPDCGLVVQDRAIDVGSEWRTFSNEIGLNEDHSRVGPAENRNVIVPVEFIADWKMRDISEKLKLDSSIVDSAQSIFHKINEQGLLRGRSHELVVATCIYIACRKLNVPRSFKELEAVSKANAVSISRCYRGIVKAFKEKNLSSIIDAPSLSFSQFFIRFCSKLKLSMKVEKLANKISTKAADSLPEISSKRPDSIAAAAIYMAADLCESQKSFNEISRVTGVAVSTIRNTFKIMQKMKDFN
jgi:transcription initiation factor TFIIB